MVSMNNYETVDFPTQAPGKDTVQTALAHTSLVFKHSSKLLESQYFRNTELAGPCLLAGLASGCGLSNLQMLQ